MIEQPHEDNRVQRDFVLSSCSDFKLLGCKDVTSRGWRAITLLNADWTAPSSGHQL